MAYRLRYQAHDLELPEGDFVVGRSNECQLALDDPLVSRRHAAIRVRRDGASVEDLGSRNGVLVNGTKVAGERELSVGDRIGIGGQEMVFNAEDELFRRATQTIASVCVVDLRKAAGVTAKPPQDDAPPNGRSSPAPEPSPPARTSDATPALQTSAEVSKGVHSLQILGSLADKSLALGKADEAERILGAVLTDVLTRAKDGAVIEPSVAETAARYAGRIAAATGKGAWLDYVFQVYRHQRRVLPASIVDELHAVVRKVKTPELGGIRAYLAALREVSSSFGPADRFVFQRIEGLERLMALK